ncbi:DUF2975 domain-containing protein [Cellulosimicrobium sp. BIT-GX5]|uniref:DUF2975 domain-containing protein n=1 Tax=Cellulosimicrobium composti TaxID=2672572 RepID=A0A6N7ZNF8_9MICO|nr:DUF2975 domain-containing protein [Cellulosimicrobium composti]MTG91024.1 DUF2975 domain-containing protein [Cellulosimicrobium composti]
MSRTLVNTLRVLLVLVAAGVLLALVLAPLIATEVGVQYPEVAGLVAPYSAIAIVALLIVEVALVAVWHLLTLASKDQAFNPLALRSVNLVIACVSAVTALAATVFGHLTFGAQIGGPLVFLGLVGSLVGGAALALLLVVMRELLRNAATNRQELAEVI